MCNFTNKIRLILSYKPSLLVVSNLLLSFCLLLILSFYKINSSLPVKSYEESKPIRHAMAKQPIVEENPASGFVFYDLSLPDWAQGFQMPINGLKIPQNVNQLPGAARSYRNGRHQGVDIYCPYGTPVLAAKDGYVLSAGADYHDLPKASRERLLEIAGQLFSTPSEVTDILHGRRIILDHGICDGRWVVTVYSHLSKTENLNPGTFLRRGTIIGYVGNSGTSQSGTINGAHLHFEIRVNDHYLGEGMNPKEVGKLYCAIMRGRINDHSRY